MTSDALAQIWGVAINQAYDPKGTGEIIADWFQQIGSDYNSVAPLVQEVGKVAAG